MRAIKAQKARDKWAADNAKKNNKNIAKKQLRDKIKEDKEIVAQVKQQFYIFFIEIYRKNMSFPI